MSVAPINGKDGHVRCPRCFADMSPALIEMVGFPRPLLHWRCNSQECGALSAQLPVPRSLFRGILWRTRRVLGS